jgi:prepilin-type N-terminal cleavage/methylation domain-containing protein
MRGEKGFAFIETIVALAVLGLVAAAFLSGLCTASVATIVTGEHTVAESLARSQLEYIRDCTYQPNTEEYEVNPMLDIPEGWSMAPTVVEPVHETDDGIQKVTVCVKRNGEAVLSLFTYKVNR